MAELRPERFLSQRSRSVDASGIRKVFDLAAKLEDPVNFSIGQPDYDVPASVRQATIDAIQSRKNGYTVTQGIAPPCWNASAATWNAKTAARRLSWSPRACRAGFCWP